MDSDWANLPRHLLHSILDKLISDLDYLQFTMVCMPWNCVAKDNFKNYVKMRSCHRSPMLLIPLRKKGIWKLYNVVDDKVLHLQLRIPNERFCGSSKGWLIVIDESFTVSLINPIPRPRVRAKGHIEKENYSNIIRLPPLAPPRWKGVGSGPEDCNYCVYKATISADPILNASSCIVLVIYEDQCQMAMIRLSKDTSWTYFEERWALINEVIAVEDKFYAIDNGRRLLSFDNTSQSNSNVQVVTGIIDPKRFMKMYLVNYEKELMMIQRYICHDFGRLKRVTWKFKIFELDCDQCKWNAKSTLGDLALFLGDNSSIAVLASKIPGCKPNCIYFNHDYVRVATETGFGSPGPQDFGVYDLTNGEFSQPYSKHAMTLIKKSYKPPIWFEPNLQLYLQKP